MSKKKNTLKDLDEFLKQQAATLVPPTPLSEKVAEPQREEKKTATSSSPIVSTVPEDVSLEKILEDLETLSQKEGIPFRKKVYDLILHAAESGQQSSPEDKMLINTVLYLTNGSRWKDAVREYWRGK